MNKTWFTSLNFILSAGASAFCAEAIPAVVEHKIKIVLVGDPTVADRTGWGLGLQALLDTNKAECINMARGGRSSMSYMKEGFWTNALALKGDYYLFQFGHNNQPGKPGRSTDMATFVANMNQYVDEARAIGARPVLVTPLTHRQWNKDNPGKINSTLEPYATEVRKLALENHVPLVDLHARSIEVCEQLGREKCYEFSPVKTVHGTNDYDGTHLKGVGRVLFARPVVAELRKVVPELAPVFLTEPRDANPKIGEDAYNAVVSHDFSADYKDLQSAINAAPDNGEKPFRLLVKPGVYQGQFIVPKVKTHIQLIGEDVTNTIFTYAFNVNETNAGTNPKFKGTGMVVLADDFHASNITFQNTSGDHGQALALRVDGDRAVLDHCRLLGWQDTLRLEDGRSYLMNCYIEGRVDFIYGSGTAVFDQCEIHSKNGGHVTAASTPQDHPFGFVFMNCKLTGDTNAWAGPDGIPANAKSQPMADLGRPWRPYASVTYLNCWIDSHIKPEGWNNWRNPTNELTARYAEYNSTGPGANPDKRVKWAKQLTADEAKMITIQSILSGKDAWNPTAQSV
jgi:pectinesterase